MDFIPFDITIDYSPLGIFFSQPLKQILTQIFFTYGGWVVFVLIFLVLAVKSGWKKWLKRVRKQFASEINYTLLAIDVPKENLQGPEAIEQLFVHLSGTLSGGNLVDKYWKGKIQDSFSMEIISIEGYIQFLIRTPHHFRDLVEAAVFAQYPDAEIAEVSDYAENAPEKFPDEEYDLWGTELILYNNQAYPIKTYPDFEYAATKEFKDPMAAILEILSKMGKGEQLWLQIIITPTGTDWKKAGGDIVKKILGKEPPPKETLADKLFNSPMKILETAGDIVFSREKSVPAKKDEAKVKDLTPGEKNILESVEEKMTKIGFLTKFRMIYLGKKEVFKKSRGVAAVLGSLKQFNTLHLNGLKPDGEVTTGADYFFVKRKTAQKQTAIMAAYKKRSNKDGSKPYVLNTEELATLYHFPVSAVKAPSIKKSEAKKGEPPFGLPMIDERAIKEAEAAKKSPEELRKDMVKLDEPPANLPFAEE